MARQNELKSLEYFWPEYLPFHWSLSECIDSVEPGFEEL